MLGGADNPNGELLSYIIGADTINILTNDKVFKAGLRRKMRKAAMDRNYLASVLAGSGLSAAWLLDATHQG